MVRAPFYDENGIKRGAWSSEEDDKLRAYVERYGYWNWRELPKYAGLQRCGKSCRLRWMNYLRPDVRRGNYTAEEESLIIKLHEEHGNKWSLIAANLPGRTDNEIKNYWHTHLKKHKTHNKTPTKSQLRELDRSCDESSQLCHSNNGETSEAESSINHGPILDNHDHGAEVVSPAVPILESSQSPTDTSTDTSGSSLFISHAYSSQSYTDYSSENNNYQSSSVEAFYQEYYTEGSDFWTQPFLSSQNDDQYPTCFGDGGTSSSHLSFYDDGMDYYFYQ